MEIQGTVIQLLPLQTGQGKNGVWQKQEFIIETPGQYPKRVALSLWGEENINKYDLEAGLKITAHINIESREHQGRWYTEVRVWKIEMPESQRRSAPEPSKEQWQAQPEPGGDFVGSDDLPF
jgi:hypothetical protein